MKNAPKNDYVELNESENVTKKNQNKHDYFKNRKNATKSR